MRISPYWKERIKIEKQYRTMNCDVPASVKADYIAKEYLDSIWRHLHKCTDGNAISNAMWEFLANVKETDIDPNTSKEMANQIDIAIKELVNLYGDLKEADNGYFINANTLTRSGRKRVRESADRIGLLLKKMRTHSIMSSSQ